ncbi:MAG: GspH/FimT family pseudopilin [Pseudogulbenkiania sp.]|nr:GspH/FimT family pseudopilin [Pseudogulbenkiania sp.]
MLHYLGKIRGFTLIEMLVVIAIGAILLTLAVPGFAALMASSRMDNRTQALLSSVQFARSEAIRSNGNVYLCALNAKINLDVQGCQGKAKKGNTSWSEGVLLFADRPGGRATRYDSGERRRHVIFSGELTVSSTLDKFMLTPEGRLPTGISPSWVVRDAASGQCASVSVQANGRPRLCKGADCAGCA